MSANKVFDTKVPENETDSGFLSGQLTEENLKLEADEGLEELTTEELAKLPAEAEEPPLVVIEDDKSNIPQSLRNFFLQDDDGDTKLHIASVHGCEKSVSTLIRVCPDKAWMNVSNDYGHTALHLAVMSGHAVITRMLVLAGASLDVRDVCGRTPLHLAVETKHLDCLQSLVAPSPNNTREKMTRILNTKDYKGQTCIHYAAHTGQFEAIQKLVYYGADILAGEGLAGWTALHIAAKAGNASLVRCILERYAHAAQARDYSGRGARRLAARSPAAAAFAAFAALAQRRHDSDTDDCSDDDDTDSDSDNERESLFERLQEQMSAINVA